MLGKAHGRARKGKTMTMTMTMTSTTDASDASDDFEAHATDAATDATMGRVLMDIAAALEFRAALMRRGNWSHAEMTMAGDRIAAAQSAAAALAGRAR